MALFHIEGRVWVEMVEGFSLLGQDFTLALEDGRVLDFFLADNSGRIANRSDRFKVNAPLP